EGYGVASFYHLFSMKERPAVVAHVCDDIACKAAGADALCATLEGSLGARFARSPCLGLCEQAPAAMLVAAGEAPFERGFGHATAETVRRAVEARTVPEPPRTVLPQAGDAVTMGGDPPYPPARPALRLLRRVG